MNSYHQARSSALKELADAAKQKEILDKRIARLKQTLASLDALIEGDEASTESRQEMDVVGITDAVRNALKIANSPRTAVDVRDWLASSGYDLSDQENALASIHTILKRLVRSGEAQDGLNETGKAVYKWAGSPQTLSSLYAAQAAIAIRQALAIDPAVRDAASVATSLATAEAVRGITLGPPKRLTRKQQRLANKSESGAAVVPKPQRAKKIEE